MQSVRRWAHVLRVVTLDKLLVQWTSLLDKLPRGSGLPCQEEMLAFTPGMAAGPGSAKASRLGASPMVLLTRRAFHLRGLGRRPTRTGGHQADVRCWSVPWSPTGWVLGRTATRSCPAPKGPCEPLGQGSGANRISRGAGPLPTGPPTLQVCLRVCFAF